MLTGGGKDREEEGEAAASDRGCRAIMRREAGLEDDGGPELETGNKWSTMVVGGSPDPGGDLKLRPRPSSYLSEHQRTIWRTLNRPGKRVTIC